MSINCTKKKKLGPITTARITPKDKKLGFNSP
jgi:hypothetical protein